MFLPKQELSRSSLSVSPTSYISHGFSLLDDHHLVLMVPARYPHFDCNNAFNQLAVCYVPSPPGLSCRRLGVALTSKGLVRQIFAGGL